MARSSPHKFWVVFFHLPHLRFRSLLFVAPVTGHGTLERASGQRGRWKVLSWPRVRTPNDHQQVQAGRGDPNLHLRTLASIHLFVLPICYFIELQIYRNLGHIICILKNTWKPSVCLPIRFFMLPCAYLFTDVLITHTIPILLLHFFYLYQPDLQNIRLFHKNAHQKSSARTVVTTDWP